MDQDKKPEPNKLTEEQRQKQQERYQQHLKATAEQLSSVQFWKFINNGNFISALELIMQNLNGNRKTFIKTYILDIALVISLLIVVSILGFYKILDGVTVGTLVGAIIGYALGRFREQ